MKITVMSDSHLYRVTPEFEELCERFCADADLVIHLGDFAVAAVWDYLQQFPVEGVAGNMDDRRIRDELPDKRTLRVKNRRIGLIHGYGRTQDLRQRLQREFSGVDAVLFGHTHQPLRLEENGCLWFNPGSVSQGRGGAGRSIGVLRIGERIEGEFVSL
jgi:hypothetical protein